jgi:hypothetical protein
MQAIAHGGMNPRATEKPKMPAKELEHIRVSEAENGGHLAEHHFSNFEHPPEQNVFAAGGAKPMLPKGHILQHIAEHMHMPHSVIEEQSESAHATNTKGHEPDEEEELEGE